MSHEPKNVGSLSKLIKTKKLFSPKASKNKHSPVNMLILDFRLPKL